MATDLADPLGAHQHRNRRHAVHQPDHRERAHRQHPAQTRRRRPIRRRYAGPAAGNRPRIGPTPAVANGANFSIVGVMVGGAVYAYA